MDIYELIGFIIGDGNIYFKPEKRKYRLELCGNVNEDFEYFKEIERFLFDSTGRKPLLFTRIEKKGKSLRIQFNNKVFLEKLISMGLPIGKKTFSIAIPSSFVNNDGIMSSIIRGLFEADGCLYFSKSKKLDYPSYPRLEIKTSSLELAHQIKFYLEKKDFKVYVRKGRIFVILISGERMLEKWINEIGLVSLKNNTKYKIWKAKGFYIPKTPLRLRKELCAGGTTALRPILS